MVNEFFDKIRDSLDKQEFYSDADAYLSSRSMSTILKEMLWLISVLETRLENLDNERKA